MKKIKSEFLVISFVILSIFLINKYCFSQLLIENFDYSEGDFLIDHNWTAHSSPGTNPVTIAEDGLDYKKHPGTGIGKAALLDNTGEDVNFTFTPQSSGNIYYSFLVRITNISSGYFIHLRRSATLFAARVFIQNSEGNLQFGLSNTNTGTFSPTNFSTETTYLCIVKYDISSTGIASLWVFSTGVPPDESSAGDPLIEISGSGQEEISHICLRQYSSSQNITVDAIRIATSWGDMSLPVTLTDFSAFYENEKVMISWTTESELENLGFNLYRSTNSNDQFSMINDRLIPGAGNSSSRHEYTYTDGDIVTGMTYYYKLEDVSLSGQTGLLGPVSVTIPPQAEQNSDDSGFYLGPNFPNPCNPRTEIQFVVAEPCQVTLEVYDLLGNRIKTLTDAGYDRGDYSLIWDGTDDQGHLVGSGVYFYRMMTDTGALLTRKLILLR